MSTDITLKKREMTHPRHVDFQIGGLDLSSKSRLQSIFRHCSVRGIELDNEWHVVNATLSTSLTGTIAMHSTVHSHG